MPKNADHLKEYRWQPGKSGNPKGRPKGTTISDAYRKILASKLPPGTDLPKAFRSVLEKMVNEGATIAEFVALAQIKEAIKGRTGAASEIADRVEGKPKQQHQITGPTEGPLALINYDLDKLEPDELRKMIEILSKAEPDGSSSPGD